MLIHKGTKNIETKRLILRPFLESDVGCMYKDWASDPDVTEYLTWDTHSSVEDTKLVIDIWVRGYKNAQTYNWAMELKETKEVIGSIGFIDLNNDLCEAEAGYCMSKEYWGRGIMTEALCAVIGFAFTEVGFAYIYAVHDVRNPVSGSVMKKCGMRYISQVELPALSNNLQPVVCSKYEISAVAYYYDRLIMDENDPVHDPSPLKEYMDKWDGNNFLDELKLYKNKDVLEVGVGTGRLAVKTCTSCKSFTGIDLSSKTIERAKTHLSVFKNVTLLLDDFMEHNFTAKYDIVYSSLTFMHIAEKLKAIRKVSALLKDGGRFVLSVDKNPQRVMIYNDSEIQVYPDNPREISHYLSLSGLEEIKIFETELAFIFVAEKIKQ